MELSQEILSQFAKLVTKSKKTSTESTVYGTVVVDSSGNKYVKLDGSDQLTPLSDDERPVADSTTASANEGERVSVLIKNHTATVTGNMSSPAARSGDVKDLGDQVSEIQKFDILIGEQVQANEGYIKRLQADKANVSELNAANAKITELEANKATVEELNAAKAEITDLKATKLDVSVANITYATVEKLNAVTADITDLKAKDVTVEGKLEAAEADIADLEAKKLSAEDAEIKYANIDFANIDKAAFENLYSKSGLIENIVVGDGTIAGNLVGVTIKGDLIEGNTIVADKLVVRGEDGLYYKLNTQCVTPNTYADGYVKMETTIDAVEGTLIDNVLTTDGTSVYSYANSVGDTAYYTVIDGVYYNVALEANSVKVEQTAYNSINGSVITAKSITAEQISVKDLVAFGATIGGFNITSDAIYSEVKDSEDNTTRGIYLDTDGQVNIGDASNFIKYTRNEDGTFSLSISASDIMYALDGTQHSLSNLGKIGEYVKIGMYDDEPCIELGENDSDFKLVITNTRILFMEGTTVPAHINNQSLHIKKAVIEEEMRLGQFVWQVRANGNMGLVWQDIVEVEEVAE